MTMEFLERVLKENNIPKDVHFMSDSGWEGGPTGMEGIFYNKHSNTIVFTQGDGSDREYERLDEWEILYIPGLIKLEGLEVYPTFHFMNDRITEEFKKALKLAGDFEMFYGIRETEDKYDVIDVDRPLFYSIHIKGKLIGYIGFCEHDSSLEVEIYIFEPYRNKGYGTRVLQRFIDIAFKDGLPWKGKRVHPSKLISTVRVENIYSQKMMRTCGFDENKEAKAEFLFFLSEEKDSEADFIQVKEFELTKEKYRECL